MKKIKGPAIFLAQFAADEEPFNSLDNIAKWASNLGYKGVQIPSWDGRLIDLNKTDISLSYTTNCQQMPFPKLMILLKQFNIKFNINFKNEIFSFYDTPGVILNYTKFFEKQITDSKETNLKNIILNLMDFNKSDRNHINLFLLQNIIELFFYTKIVNTNNKVKVFANYSKAINHLNNFKKYNIDMNNTFYEIKENIIHA